MNELTTTESASLAENERIIKNTRGAFVACGNALAAIRDSKLYRAKYGTFEEYCEKKWGWKRAHAYRLIAAAEVMKMSPNGRQISTERAARELAKVPEENREEVLDAAGPKASGGKISKAAKDTSPVVEVDETGYPIPDKIVEIWKRGQDARMQLTEISAARGEIRKIDPNDKLYAEVNISSVLANLNQAFSEFAQAVPYAVCTTCQGVTIDTCSFCKGRGVISKFRYDTCVPEELKTIRSKGK